MSGARRRRHERTCRVNDRPVRTAARRATGSPGSFLFHVKHWRGSTAYVELLRAWNRRINLVGATTMGDLWRRHILDSAQLLPAICRRTARVLVDLGSGAGLPGLVLAHPRRARGPSRRIRPAQSRLPARGAARHRRAPAILHAQRIEAMRAARRRRRHRPRARAACLNLLDLAETFLARRTACAFSSRARGGRRIDRGARKAGG